MFKILLPFSLFYFCLCGCPNGTIASFSNPNNCYLFVSNQTQFINAEGYCRQQGGDLTSVGNAFDNMFLSQKASLSFHDASDTNFWLGATTELIPGNWTWLDGTPFDYSDWAPGQPGNVSISKCATSSTTTSLWTAVDCFQNKSYVCLIPTPSKTTCDNGWKYFDQTGFCYKNFPNLNKTWAEAEHYCQQSNSHLVSIHSQLESDFVADLARSSLSSARDSCYNNQTWIGLFSLTDKKDWLWTDFSNFDYLGWASNEPNMGHQNENCALILLTQCDVEIKNYWSSELCEFYPQSFVCKKSTN